jgi:hypothetical protein
VPIPSSYLHPTFLYLYIQNSVDDAGGLGPHVYPEKSGPQVAEDLSVFHDAFQEVVHLKLAVKCDTFQLKKAPSSLPPSPHLKHSTYSVIGIRVPGAKRRSHMTQCSFPAMSGEFLLVMEVTACSLCGYLTSRSLHKFRPSSSILIQSQSHLARIFSPWGLAWSTFLSIRTFPGTLT